MFRGVQAVETKTEEKGVTIYTDGGCMNNPGPGGYGVVLLYGEKRKELSGGFELTTNNRMELTACIEGLKALKYPCKVTLFSDSQYVVNGITKGWAERWKRKGWMRSQNAPAENYDLWGQLLELCKVHRVEFEWVRGHAGNIENERCDRLASEGMTGAALAHDEAYENNRTTV
jgi:ribonuclease HI